MEGRKHEDVGGREVAGEEDCPIRAGAAAPRRVRVNAHRQRPSNENGGIETGTSRPQAHAIPFARSGPSFSVEQPTLSPRAKTEFFPAVDFVSAPRGLSTRSVSETWNTLLA